jgi:hypothetical protein
MAQGSSPAIDLDRAMKNVQFNEAAQAGAAAAADPMAFFRNVELSGFVDLYYGYNLNKPLGGSPALRNFDVNHNQFSLNLAEFAIEKKPTTDSRGGFRLDLDYGPTAAMVNAFEPGKKTAILETIEQAYVSYLSPGAHGVQIDIGKFVTHNGAEVIETKDNWNYSRSLLFTLAIPYYHMGARFTVSPSDKVTLMGEVTNGWNNVYDNNGGKTVGAEVTLKPTGAVTIVQNYTGGPETGGDNKDWRHLSDTVITYTATPKLSLMANYDYGHGKVEGTWSGVAGYLKIQPSSCFAFIPRVEWLNDKDTFMTGVAQKVKEATLTAELKDKGGFTTRIEYRRDFSDKTYFLKNTNSFIKNQDTFTIGFFYAFSSKTP